MREESWVWAKNQVNCHCHHQPATLATGHFIHDSLLSSPAFLKLSDSQFSCLKVMSSSWSFCLTNPTKNKMPGDYLAQLQIRKRLRKTNLKHVCTVQFSSVQLLSRVRLFASPWTAARQACLSITNSRSPPKLKSIESVMPSSHLILCRPLLLLPSIFPSIRVFSNESALRMCVRF